MILVAGWGLHQGGAASPSAPRVYLAPLIPAVERIPESLEPNCLMGTLDPPVPSCVTWGIFLVLSGS